MTEAVALFGGLMFAAGFGLGLGAGFKLWRQTYVQLDRYRRR